MAHKFCFEALNQSLRDIIKAKSSPGKIFGGKLVVFGGDLLDFDQVLQNKICEPWGLHPK